MTDNRTEGQQPSALPDTAMMTGSDDGEPGERLAQSPLSDGDNDVLAELSRHDEPVVDAVEDSSRAVSAVEHDTAVPGAGGPPRPDPLTPVFQEPPG